MACARDLQAAGYECFPDQERCIPGEKAFGLRGDRQRSDSVKKGSKYPSEICESDRK